jgi:uncharacterized protein YaaR (DUF327 family)
MMGSKSVYGVLFLVMLAPTWCARVKARGAHSKLEPKNAAMAGDDELTGLQVAVQNVQANLEKLEGAFKAKLPAVSSNLSDFAGATRDRAIVLSSDLLMALNGSVCDPVKQEEFKEHLAELQSKLGEVAAFMASKGAEYWPKAKEAVNSFVEETPDKLLALKTNLEKEVADSDKIQALLAEVNSKFEEIKSSYLEPLESNEKLMYAISNFSGAVTTLSAKISVEAQSVYEKNETQVLIATIKSRTGQLITSLADKWPGAKANIAKFVAAAPDELGKVTEKVLAEVNMCIPEKRQQAAEAFAAIKSRTGTLASAIKEGEWTVVEEQLSDFIESLSSTVDVIRTSAVLMLGPQGKNVQDALSAVNSQVEAVRDGIVKKASSLSLSDIAERAKKDTAITLAKLGELGQKLKLGELGQKLGKGVQGLHKKITGLGKDDTPDV